MASLRDTPYWYDAGRSEVMVAQTERAALEPENIRKARKFLDSLQEDYNLLHSEEVRPNASDTEGSGLSIDERRSNPFFDDPRSPWKDLHDRPPTPETITKGMCMTDSGPEFKNELVEQTQEQFRTYFNSLEAWDKARKLAIAEEKLRIREKAIKTKGKSPPKESQKIRKKNEDELEDVRSLTSEQFFEEARKSGGAIQAKALILENDGQDIDCILDFNFFNGTLMHLAAEFGHTETITFLLDHGAGIDVENMWGATPLEYAISKDHVST
ncbi:hypothetical protein K458DRAFT_365381, partial [Lentithecium fluviatile CBS 122367]